MPKCGLILILSLLFVSCERRDFSFRDLPDDRITITTFNAEWLGDQINDRKARKKDDYKVIANVLLDLNSDFIALQEVENEAALKKILRYMPDYKFIIPCNRGAQNIAAIYHKNINAKLAFVADEVCINNDETRPAIVVDLAKNKFKTKAILVHFKSTSRYDSTQAMKILSRQIRVNQAKATVGLIERELHNKDQNIILLGDFNDFPRRKKNNTLYPIMSNQNLIFLTHDLRSCRFLFSYSIDNIVITKSLNDFLIPNSLRSYDINVAYPDYLSKSISDHCPVSVSFRTTTSN